MPFSFGIIALIKWYVFSLEVCILVVQLWEVYILSSSSNVLLLLRLKLYNMRPSNCEAKGGAPTFPSCLGYLGACCSSLPQPVQLTQRKTAPPLRRNGFLVGWWLAQAHRGVWGARELPWTEEWGRTFSFSSASHGSSHGLNAGSKIKVLCCGFLSFILSSLRLGRVFTLRYSLS